MTHWGRINREDKLQQDRVALRLDWTFTGVAVALMVTGLLGSHDRGRVLGSIVVNLVLGLSLLVIGLRARRRNRQGPGK